MSECGRIGVIGGAGWLGGDIVDALLGAGAMRSAGFEGAIRAGLAAAFKKTADLGTPLEGGTAAPQSPGILPQ